MNYEHFYQLKSDGSNSAFGAPWQPAEQEIGRSRPRLSRSQTFRPRLPQPRKPLRRPFRRRPWFPRSVGYGNTVFTEPEPRTEGSEYVRWVQATLNQVLNLRLPVDGVLDVQTRSAIRSFQEKNGLPVTGIVGPDTERALMSAGRGQSPAASAVTPDEPGAAQPSQSDASPAEPEPNSPAEPAPTSPTPEFEYGWESEVNRSSTEYIRWVQQSLNKIMGLRLAVDGIKGPMTNSAIRSFQQKYGLLVDGIVGPQTEGALIKAGAGNPPGSGSSPYIPPSRPTTPYIPPSTPAPSRPAPSGIIARILDIARSKIGFKEGPDNDNPFSAYFGEPNRDWCVYFVSYVYTLAGFPLSIGWTDDMLTHLLTKGRFFSNTTVPQPADIVVYDWDPSNQDPAEHVGLVEKVSRDSSGQIHVITIEGNVGRSGVVDRRDRLLGDSQVVGFGRLVGI